MWIIGFVIFLLMQQYKPAHNESYQETDINVKFTIMYDVPKNVETILRTTCYDCHSNITNYPLYSYIQNVRFFMQEDIKDGKKNLNFNEFGKYSNLKQENKLEAIIKQIKSDEMPLGSQTLIYRNAILTRTQKEEIINQIKKTKDSLSVE